MSDLIRSYVRNDGGRTISVKKSERYPELRVLKYKNKVFYNRLWDGVNVDMRGTVVDEDFNVVTMPLRKIFNYGEMLSGSTLQDDDPVVAVEKINGFMIAVSYYSPRNEWICSTTGSLDSEFAEMGRDVLLREGVLDILDGCGERGLTYVFEITHRDDPHIIPEDEGIHLIGVRASSWNSEPSYFSTHSLARWAGDVGLMSPPIIGTTFGKLKDMTSKSKREGYVVYSLIEKPFKMKSPYYLTTKFVGRMSDKRMEALAENPIVMKKLIEEEYYPLIDHIHENLDEFRALDKQARIAYVREFLGR